ncbi:divergent PAP2 family protein [Anaeropeptidivorans aminofermentans]|uniref:divergent PAP2 family protein n=1 Tax=Anaeropeptidivorans aminofermentans TaxID=2934315 RepID=UPI002025307C|nr:divergent PAP2 family protein [Anaeropeptidivorans aminofermentans]MBE6013616.1 divergent PAP2 family protein [Lachnospiraceae bacterium]
MKYINQIINNSIFWTASFSWAIAQLIKIMIEFKKERRLSLALMISSGGMPSSHSSFVSAMSTSVGLLEGFDSTAFAICAVISMVVMYDAAGVRRAAGKQAEIINKLVANIENTGIVLDKKLKELLGHSPVEVAAGAVLGIVVSVAAYNM